MAELKSLIHGDRTNAAIGWLSTGVVGGLAVWSVLTGNPLWGVFSFLLVAVLVAPAVITRRWVIMVPWPLALIIAVAAFVGSLGRYVELVNAVTVATLALVAVIELSAFTDVELSRRFAVAFTVLTTMAIQGVLTIIQFYADKWLGTSFLRTQTELQWDLVAVTLVGLLVAGLFQWYFTSDAEDSAQLTRSEARS